MDKRAIIEHLLDEFELLVTQYQYELTKTDDEMSRMTSEAIRVTRQRIVDEAIRPGRDEIEQLAREQAYKAEERLKQKLWPGIYGTKEEIEAEQAAKTTKDGE